MHQNTWGLTLVLRCSMLKYLFVHSQHLSGYIVLPPMVLGGLCVRHSKLCSLLCSGMMDTILENGDTVVFISTLHGG